jgi:hypothetical protein
VTSQKVVGIVDDVGLVPALAPSREEKHVMPQPTRDQVFISYSHKDNEWLEKFRTMLKPLVRNESISVWDDRKITAGAIWREEIKSALAAAKVAVLLVSPNFLGSDFIAQNELPPLLEAAKNEGLVIVWVCVSSCLYDETEIKDYQAAHDISKPLDSLTQAEQSSVLTHVCKQIKAAQATSRARPLTEYRSTEELRNNKRTNKAIVVGTLAAVAIWFLSEESLYRLGDMYKNGEVFLTKDLDKARFLYWIAAEMGNPWGMENLGDLYEQDEKYKDARYWYEKAANKGISWAMLHLSRLYETGLGGEKDVAKAKFWHDKAAADPEVKKALKE